MWIVRLNVNVNSHRLMRKCWFAVWHRTMTVQFKIINLIDNQAQQMHIICQRDLFITLYLIKLVQTRLVRWIDSWKSDATAKVSHTNIYVYQTNSSALELCKHWILNRKFSLNTQKIASRSLGRYGIFHANLIKLLSTIFFAVNGWEWNWRCFMFYDIFLCTSLNSNCCQKKKKLNPKYSTKSINWRGKKL